MSKLDVYNQLPESSRRISKYEEIRPLISLPIEDTEFRQPCYYATPFSQTFNLTIFWINKKLGIGYGIADNSISQQINWYLFGDQSTWSSFNKDIAAQFKDDLS